MPPHAKRGVMPRTYLLTVAFTVAVVGGVRAQETSYAPRPVVGVGPELVAVVISAAYCEDSQRTDYRESIEQMKLRLRDTAQERGMTFAVIGVAVDWSAEEGLRHLQRLGQFDQFVIGGGWTNVATVELVDRWRSGALTIPQVLVIERTLGANSGSAIVSGGRVVERLVGVDAIVRWAAEGFALN